MADGAEAVPEKVGGSLGHKLGPLPVWAWVVGAVVITAGGYYLLVGRKGGGGAASFPNMPGTLGGGSGGGGTTGTTTATSTVPTLATAAQIQAALTQVASTLGITYAEAQMYWNEYIAGTSPVGSTQASGLFSSLVNSMNTLLGATAPPAPTTGNVNTNPFANNSAWLNDILAFLPGGTSSADINNIIAWLNGTTTTLTQSASDALNKAIGIVGQAPNPLQYTISNPLGPAPKKIATDPTPTGSVPTVPSLSAIWTWWQGSAWWNTANPGATFQTAIQSLVPGLSGSQAQSVWNFTQTNPSYFASNGNEYANLQALLTQLLNGQTLSTVGLPYQPAVVTEPGPKLGVTK